MQVPRSSSNSGLKTPCPLVHMDVMPVYDAKRIYGSTWIRTDVKVLILYMGEFCEILEGGPKSSRAKV